MHSNNSFLKTAYSPKPLINGKMKLLTVILFKTPPILLDQINIIFELK